MAAKNCYQLNRGRKYKAKDIPKPAGERLIPDRLRYVDHKNSVFYRTKEGHWMLINELNQFRLAEIVRILDSEKIHSRTAEIVREVARQRGVIADG